MAHRSLSTLAIIVYVYKDCNVLGFKLVAGGHRRTFAKRTRYNETRPFFLDLRRGFCRFF